MCWMAGGEKQVAFTIQTVSFCTSLSIALIVLSLHDQDWLL